MAGPAGGAGAMTGRARGGLTLAEVLVAAALLAVVVVASAPWVLRLQQAAHQPMAALDWAGEAAAVSRSAIQMALAEDRPLHVSLKLRNTDESRAASVHAAEAWLHVTRLAASEPVSPATGEVVGGAPPSQVVLVQCQLRDGPGINARLFGEATRLVADPEAQQSAQGQTAGSNADDDTTLDSTIDASGTQ